MDLAIMVYLLCIPFILIWAINGLFHLNLEYTLHNWFYLAIVFLMFRGRIEYKQ